MDLRLGDQLAVWPILCRAGLDLGTVELVNKAGSAPGFEGVVGQAIRNLQATLEVRPSHERQGHLPTGIRCFGAVKWAITERPNVTRIANALPWRDDVFYLLDSFDRLEHHPIKINQSNCLVYVPRPIDLGLHNEPEESPDVYGERLVKLLCQTHECHLDGSCPTPITPDDWGWHLFTADTNPENNYVHRGRPEIPINYKRASQGVSVIGLLAALEAEFGFLNDKDRLTFQLPGCKELVILDKKKRTLASTDDWPESPLWVYERRRPEINQYPNALTLMPRE